MLPPSHPVLPMERDIHLSLSTSVLLAHSAICSSANLSFSPQPPIDNYICVFISQSKNTNNKAKQWGSNNTDNTGLFPLSIPILTRGRETARGKKRNMGVGEPKQAPVVTNAIKTFNKEDVMGGTGGWVFSLTMAEKFCR